MPLSSYRYAGYAWQRSEGPPAPAPGPRPPAPGPQPLATLASKQKQRVYTNFQQLIRLSETEELMEALAENS